MILKVLIVYAFVWEKIVIEMLNTQICTGNSVRRSTRLILKSLQRPISDPVYIDLEADDADQVRKAETMKNVGDIISEEGKNGLVRGI